MNITDIIQSLRLSMNVLQNGRQRGLTMSERIECVLNIQLVEQPDQFHRFTKSIPFQLTENQQIQLFHRLGELLDQFKDEVKKQ